ncbi:MAG: DUF1592 domain-containing protein [Rhodospirillaceae bacterium]|nr:DUF1592 domain-containing protein [Rhodospirillaceae bacterium]
MRNVFKKKAWLGAAAVALALAACSQADMGTKTATTTSKEAVASNTVVAGGPVVMRRLTQKQYEQTIADLFGKDIIVGGPFEPDQREAGLLAVGAGQVSVAASGVEQYNKMGRNIAAQVVDEKNRTVLIGCTPANAKQPDDACAKQFLARVGKFLYRRPLTDSELNSRVAAAHEAAKLRGNFYLGLETSLATLLVSPQFLFVQEATVTDKKGNIRLDGYSKASRLSFLLWNNAPDDELLAAAAKGDLDTPKGLAKQVDRMIASPRLEDGLRAFFTDMLEFDRYETLSKDSTLYPKFNFKVGEEEKEQTLRTIVDHLITRNGDYRDLFTTRHTYLTRTLAAIYEVPLKSVNAGWQPYEFAPDSGHAGILTHASFVSLHSHPGRTSPTLRGKALREALLCQRVPDPPGNVNFAIVQDTNNPNFKTVRQRLTAHATEAMCTGCHKIMDPMGLALENFDTVGGYRKDENGTKIDASGELDGVKFNDAAGLGQVLRNNANATSCVVNRIYSYGLGRKPTKSETEWLKTVALKNFEADGYKIPMLLKRIATSDTFFRVIPADTAAPKVAAAQ